MNQTTFTPDLSLLRVSSLSDAHTYPPVCVTSFEKDGCALHYINARHRRGPNSLDIPTIRTIDAAMEIFKPRSVVIETGGWPTGPHFATYLAELKDRYAKDTSLDNVESEAAYTILLAQKNGVPTILNGEPTNTETYRALRAHGYTPAEYQAYHVLLSLTL